MYKRQALLRRFHEARQSGAEEVQIWGSGTPRREFLHVDDLAEACLFLLGHGEPPDLVNVGVGEDIAIRDLADLIARTVGYEGKITTDPSKPDGTPRKLMDTSRINAMGWSPKISLEDGLQDAYRCFLDQLGDGTLRS